MADGECALILKSSLHTRAVLEHYLASLWATNVTCSGHTVEPEGPDTPKLGDETSFRKGQTVHGYVRSVQPAKSKGAGLYVSLADDVVARIQLRNLSDTYVEDPVKSFPEGMHISARVIKSQDGRIEMTCKTAKPSGNIQGLEDFSLGQVCVTVVHPWSVYRPMV